MYAATVGCKVYAFWVHVYGSVGCKVCGWWVQSIWILLGAKSLPFGCMYAAFGCMSMARLGACMQLLGACLTAGSLPDSM